MCLKGGRNCRETGIQSRTANAKMRRGTARRGMAKPGLLHVGCPRETCFGGRIACSGVHLWMLQRTCLGSLSSLRRFCAVGLVEWPARWGCPSEACWSAATMPRRGFPNVPSISLTCPNPYQTARPAALSTPMFHPFDIPQMAGHNSASSLLAKRSLTTNSR